MKKIPKIALGTGLVITAIALVGYFAKQASMLRKSCYTLAGAIINNISFNNVKLTLLVNIKNKSDIPFTVYNQRYSVYVNGLLVSKIERDGDSVIDAQSKSVFQVNVEFNPQDLLRAGIINIEPLLYDKEKLMIDLRGNISLKSGLVRIRNYKVEEKMSLKELLTPNPEDENC
jgi:LEA14-like dessication related protein